MAKAVRRFETGEPLLAMGQDRLRAALEQAGVEFTIGDATGVRLRKGDAA